VDTSSPILDKKNVHFEIERDGKAFVSIRFGLRRVILLWGYHADYDFCNSDYINPIDLCNRLNTYIVPEAAVHAFLTFLFLINGYWIALVLNLPLLAWNAKKYEQYTGGSCVEYRWRAKQEYRIFDNQHLLDATEIFRKLNVHKKVRGLRYCALGVPGVLQILGCADDVFVVIGIICKAWFPSDHVLLLPVLDDRWVYRCRIRIRLG